MKLIVVGMDGASFQTVRRGYTPTIQRLLESGTPLNLQTDLYSRGWSEIMTGCHASTTGAAYDRPLCNGSKKWIEKFNLFSAIGYGSKFTGFWEKLKSKDIRVGIMNIPTTYPAPEVNGFFVSGGGGGAPVVSSPTPEMCYPGEIRNDLLKFQYIVDERIGELYIERGLTTEIEILDRMKIKNERRTDAFIKLAEKFKIDVGFIVYKTSSVLVEGITVQHEAPYQNGSIDNEKLTSIQHYYHHFDNQILKLYSLYPEATFLFVADHGMVRKEFTFNPNKLLEKYGYLTSAGGSIVKSTAISIAKRFVPFRIKKYLKRKTPLANMARDTLSFDGEASKAFCRTFGDWRYGIYLNDLQRFNGPISSKRKFNLIETILRELNNDDLIKKHKISFSARALEHPDWWPDIIIDCPDGFLISDKTTEIILENKAPPAGITGIFRGEINSVKSTKPLSFVSGDFGISISEYINGDLASAHDLILKLACRGHFE